ncbi:Low-temperature-induced 65 kDa protein [Abeliophyllum distichum]|uniref:Low-temperature-induced 65 kDa protein n=1 Tax=Abeliophyllum distichum TaxID=126358 RepID=A0ABD1UQH3_9LAMI
MESELNRQGGQHGYEEEPRTAGLHSAVEGEGEGEHLQGEKKSVLTKVKDRAKKIRDTIKKHSYGNNPEEEEEDEETVDDPQVQGAPTHESSVIKNVDLGQGITPGQTGVNLEKPTDKPEDRFNKNIRSEGFPRPSAPSGIRDEAITRTPAPGGTRDEAITRPSAPSGIRDEAITRTPGPGGTQDEAVTRSPGPGGTQDDVGRATAMETDEAITRPSAPEKMRDDMGRATARETTQTAYGEVADSPVMGREEANVGQARVKNGQPMELEEDPDSPKNLPGTSPPSNHQSKVVDPTGTGGKEADVAPLVHQFDKMNVNDQTDPKSKPESEQRLYTGSPDQFAPQPTPTKDLEGRNSQKPASESTPESNTVRTSTDPSKTEDVPSDTVTGKLSYATSAITGNAISAKNMVATKLGYGGQEEGRDSQKPASESTKPVSETASEHVHNVGGHEEGRNSQKHASESTPESNTIRTSTDPSKTEDVPSDTVTGKLSYATSAITGNAISAKNMVATKLGYGGQEEGRDSQKPASESTKPVSETASEYVHNVAPTVTEKLAPVNQKVQGSGTRDEGGDRAVDVGNEGVAKGTDKGVSVKDYLAEKFRPGDEDKELSEAISGSLHKKKGETGGTEEGKPMGKVTESEQLARRLGTGAENKREGEDALSAGKESSGTGMVDRIKGAVGSWLGKSDGLQTAEDSLGQAYVSDTTERGKEVSGQQRQ